MGQTPLGFNSRTAAGALGPNRIDQQGAIFGSERHGKDYLSTYGTPVIGSKAAVAGSVFRGSNSAGATLSAALATTYVGLCLSNPAGATVNLVVKKVSGIIVATVSAELGLGLITGWAAGGVTVHTTAINTKILNGYIGAATASGSVLGPASQANLDAACTLVGTPLWDRWLAANAVTANNTSFYTDLGDDLILPPGAYCAIGANVAGPAAGFLGTLEWEELAP